MSGPGAMHGTETPSAWVERWAHLVPEGAAVLDVACGYGRHTRFFRQRGCDVTALDRDADALATLGNVARTVQCDIENGPWPQGLGVFGAVVVTNYLWRPVLWQVIASVASGGVLIYETFAEGNEAFGKPSRADFLLKPGELLEACRSLHVVAYEHGKLPDPDRVVQRIAAIRQDARAAGEGAFALAATR